MNSRSALSSKRGPLISTPQIIAVSIGLLLIICLSSDAGTGVELAMLVFYGGGLWALIWMICFITAICQQHNESIPRRSRREMIIYWGFEPGIMVLALVASFGGAWSGIRFRISKPFLESYVAEVSSNPAIPGKSRPDRRVGLHLIRETEILPSGTVRFITSTEGLADDAGYVYSPISPPPVIGEDNYHHITGPWYHWHRSW